METLEVFDNQKKEMKKKLEYFLKVLQNGKNFGVEILEEDIKKIEYAIKQKENEKLNVVLIGGFSEGKTSIAAAWLEEYDKTKMKIAMKESTDDIREYDIGNLHLVDTPGLFGFKETENKEKFKDITKKYVSKADIILYVMNPTNPIKNSHSEELEWLFKKLNLLSRTVFVLSCFDKVADIEDEDDYEENLKIKRENIERRLNDIGIITNNEKKSLPIVAVSANPFDEGIEYWLQNIEEYKELSHIKKLQEATTKIIQQNGGIDIIILETQKSIINDVISNRIPDVQKKIDDRKEENKKLRNLSEELEIEVEDMDKQIKNKKLALEEFIIDLFTQLIVEVKGTSIYTIEEFIDRNIGNNGIIIESKIKREFQRQIEMIETSLEQFVRSFDNKIKNYKFTTREEEEGYSEYFKFGANFLKNINLNLTSKAIIATRDFLGLAIKFKPWQAVKIANNINKAIPIIGSIAGIGIEAWESYSKNEKEKELRKVIDDMVKNFEKQQKEYYDLINDREKFDNKLFEGYYELKKKVEEIRSNLAENEVVEQNFENWADEIRELEKEINMISVR